MSHDSLNSIVSVFLDITFLPTLINQVCSSKVFVIQTNNFTKNHRLGLGVGVEDCQDFSEK